MRYVTVPMLVAHTGRHDATIRRALAASHVTVERIEGVNGLRIPLREANKMIAIHWPEIGPMAPPAVLEEEKAR